MSGAKIPIARIFIWRYNSRVKHIPPPIPRFDDEILLEAHSMYLFGRNILVAISFSLLVFSAIVVAPAVANGQAAVDKAAPVPDATARSGHWAYRKIIIGMTADDARKSLGSPKDKADDQDLYLFTDDELAQIYYDSNHAVSAISVTYYKDLAKAPTAREVLGEDAPAKPDGSIFKTVRFPKADYSVSYSKTAGDSPSVSITFQKL